MSLARATARQVVEAPAGTLVDQATKRYHDREFNVPAVKILPGEYYVTTLAHEMLVTVLGSCVSACVRDPARGIGGMNHFMLPNSTDGQWGGASAGMRYGNFAMERLINDILAKGGRRERLEVKIFGGGNVLAGLTDIGDQNVSFVESYLAAEGLPVAAKHVRGRHARRIQYFPGVGKVLLRELAREDEMAHLTLETGYRQSLGKAPVTGDVELFE